MSSPLPRQTDIKGRVTLEECKDLLLEITLLLHKNTIITIDLDSLRFYTLVCLFKKVSVDGNQNLILND